MTAICHECENPIPEGVPMTQVRHGFCDGETVGNIDGSRDEDDIDYVINYHSECYAEEVLAHVPGTAANRSDDAGTTIVQKLKAIGEFTIKDTRFYKP